MVLVHHSRLIPSKLLIRVQVYTPHTPHIHLTPSHTIHTPHKPCVHTPHTHHTPSHLTHRKTVDVPLKGFTVMIIGRLSQSKPKLTQLIESLGGRVVSKVTDNTTICVSTKGQYDKIDNMAKLPIFMPRLRMHSKVYGSVSVCVECYSRSMRSASKSFYIGF